MYEFGKNLLNHYFNLPSCSLIDLNFLQTYEVAVEHFLSALNFQAAALGRGGRSLGGQSSDPGKVMSDNIWSSLRLTLGLMGKRELYPLIEQKNLAELNQALNFRNQ